MSEAIGAICGPNYLEVSQPVGECPTCKRRRRMLILVEAWSGVYWTCMTCGERYHSDEGRMERPFARGWRAESVATARAIWKRYGRVRLSKRRLLAL